MNHIDALVNMVILLLLEKKYNKTIESIDIGNDILKIFTNKKMSTISGNSENATKLINFLKEIVENGISNIEPFIENLIIMLADKPNLTAIISKQLSRELTEENRLYKRKELINYVKKEKTSVLLSEMIRLVKNPSGNINNALNILHEKLNAISEYSPIQDGCIINEIDFENDDDIQKAAESTAQTLNQGAVLRTGWPCINEMLQGGFRRGEMWTIAALPHNYKSGLVKSFFLQLAKLNKPVLTKENKDKKPLMIFFSAEEETSVVMTYFYSYLKYVKGGIIIDVEDPNFKPDVKEITAYLKEHLRDAVNFNIKVIRIDPANTSYANLVSIIDKYIMAGYDISSVVIDYLSQISTIGCKTGGPNGTDIQDLFKRFRTEMSSRNILCITPHQLSSDAKRLIRNGIPASEFVKHLPEKGYYQGSSSIQAEVDGELFIGKAKIGKDYYLTIQRGKHRIPTVIDPNKLFTRLKFTPGAPIPEHTTEHHPCTANIDDEDDFDF